MSRCLHAFLAALVLLTPLAKPMAEDLQIGELVIDLPDDFVLGNEFEVPGSKTFEFVPKGHDIRTWSELITIQIGGPLDARLVVDSVARGFQQRCPGLQAVAGEEAGLPMDGMDTMIIIVCEDMNTAGLPPPVHMRAKQFLAIRALRSGALTYTLQYAWHHDDLSAMTPFDETSRYQTDVHPSFMRAFIMKPGSAN